MKRRCSFPTWCRAGEGEQWRRDTPLPPPRAGAGRGGRSAEAGRGPKSRYPGGGGAEARRPRLAGTQGRPNGALSFSRAIGPGRGVEHFGSQRRESEAGARWAARELRRTAGRPATPGSPVPAPLLDDPVLSSLRVQPSPVAFVYFLCLGRSPMETDSMLLSPPHGPSDGEDSSLSWNPAGHR